MKRHWYFTTHYECEMCRGETHRERRYGRRPKLWKNRHEYIFGGICYACRYDLFMGGAA